MRRAVKHSCFDGVQDSGGGPPAVPEKATGARSSRGGSRLRMTTGGHAGADAAPDGGASVKVSGIARQRVAGSKVILSPLHFALNCLY